MTLIKSISGIRGTIGGLAGEGLSPVDIQKYAIAYGLWLLKRVAGKKGRVVLGRDARVSGEMVERIVSGTLMGLGFDVVGLGLATTPTVEIMVPAEQADGGIIITASHNPGEWNALKLLNEKGEFLSASDGAEILSVAEDPGVFGAIRFPEVKQLGRFILREDALEMHIRQICSHPLVDREAIQKMGFVVAVDAVNSVGGLAVPALLRELGVRQVVELFCEPNGLFPHNPEPLPEHLGEISALIRKSGAHLGFVVDPDVDRLAIICEDGSMFGEEYTLVAVADYVLSHRPGNTVSNLSSTRALKDVTEAHGMKYQASAVGEVNVVEMMKATQAVIGGEGNGGVIFPDLHYGRDALAGIALFLTHLAHKNLSCSALRKSYPDYVVSKNKVQLSPGLDVDGILRTIRGKFSGFPFIDVDGLRIDFPEGWVHIRKSNTEPILRIYAEAGDMETAGNLANRVIQLIGN